VARGEACDTSDLDLLVEWEAGRSLLDHVALVQDLGELLGTKVHIGTERSLHWYVRESHSERCSAAVKEDPSF
jgi:predicted nucleotidyltransferase